MTVCAMAVICVSLTCWDIGRQITRLAALSDTGQLVDSFTYGSVLSEGWKYLRAMTPRKASSWTTFSNFFADGRSTGQYA